MSNSNGYVVERLNALLNKELWAVNQYMLQHKMFYHAGMLKMSEKFKEESAEEMEHADVLMKRIFTLGHTPEIDISGPMKTSHDLEKTLKDNLNMEQENVEIYRKAIDEIGQNKDFVTADILTKILESEEGHVEWLQQQISRIEQMGSQNYMQHC